MNNKKKKIFTIKEVLFLVFLTFITSFIMGYSINNINDDSLYKDDEINSLINNYNYILDNYYGEVSKSQLLLGATRGMLSSLGDEYSILIDKDDVDTFNSLLVGSYEGFGIATLQENNEVKIYNIYKDSEANKSLLKIGDIILKINDTDITSIKDMNDYIESNDLEEYILTIKRDLEVFNVNLKRSEVIIKSIHYEVMDNVGYIYINMFAANTYDQFISAIDYFDSLNIKSLIIDVRNNYGGKLSTVEEILSYFISSDKVIYKLESINNVEEVFSKGIGNDTYSIVVLQNDMSASAAEIISSSLKEAYGAEVIGTNSYGKGSVQKLVIVNENIEYKITTQHWLTSLGNDIDEIGVEPTLYIEQNNDNDLQLEKAINILKE